VDIVAINIIDIVEEPTQPRSSDDIFSLASTKAQFLHKLDRLIEELRVPSSLRLLESIREDAERLLPDDHL
jgi:hypothetical protein